MRRRAAGFTLVELLVSLAVSAVVLVGVTATFIAQVRQYQLHATQRSALANGRQALSFIERTLRTAGYGVDPDRAIIAFDSFDANNPTATAAGFPDAVMVHTRDALFRRRAQSVSASALELDADEAPLTEALRPGQILLVMCMGAREYAYVTVGAPGAQAGTRTVPLAPAAGAPPQDLPFGEPSVLFRQNARLSGECYRSPTDSPYVMKVNRLSFYVASFADSGQASDPNRTPYLMMHRGLNLDSNPAIDAADATPLAVGVEQLQLAYILNSVDATPPLVLGGSDGTPVTWDNVPAPAFTDAYNAPSRLTRHPANVRQVRVSLVTRGDKSLESSADARTTPVEELQGLENLGVVPTSTDPSRRFVRTVNRLAVAPKNLLMRAQFLPPPPVDAPSATGMGGG